QMIIGFGFDLMKVASGRSSLPPSNGGEKRSALNEYWYNRRKATKQSMLSHTVSEQKKNMNLERRDRLLKTYSTHVKNELISMCLLHFPEFITKSCARISNNISRSKENLKLDKAISGADNQIDNNRS
ncbi:9841_t:CDS:2, partial [Gigaspora margarita]